MNWEKKLTFKIDKADGELELTYTPFSMKLYQNGNELKKSGSFGGVKYQVVNIDGTTQTISILNSVIHGHIVKTENGSKINLEEKLSGLDLILGFLPAIILAIAFVAIPFITVGGILGGAMLGAMIGLSAVLSCNVIRNESNIINKLAMIAVVTIICFVIYIIIAVLLSLLFGGLYSAIF